MDDAAAAAAAIPDDDTDVPGMGTLDLQRARLIVQRATARTMIAQAASLKNVERYSLVTMISVLGSGALGVVRSGIVPSPGVILHILQFLTR